MTVETLRQHAQNLSNSCWTRHWLHWNYPTRRPWLMAINCRRGDGSPTKIYAGDMTRHGYRPEEKDGATYWVVERTNEDGSAYPNPQNSDGNQTTINHE